MKHVLKLLLIGVLAACLLLTSCDMFSKKKDDEDIFANTTEKKTTAATTVPTTAPQEEVEIPSYLEPEIIAYNQPLSVLTNTPVTTEIGNTGVTIDLTYQAWPTICRGDGDTLYAVSSLRRGHIDPFAATAFYVSNDNGATWSGPTIINNSPIDDRDTGVVYMGNGRLLVSYFTIGANDFRSGGNYETQWGNCTEEQKRAKLREWSEYTEAELASFHGSFVLLSNDYGQTWEKVKAPVSCPHGPSLMNDGRTLIYPGVSDTKIFFYVSRDYGKMWSLYSQADMPKLAPDCGYWEPHVIQLSDGSFVAGIRTGGDNRELGILITTSEDGKKWTTPTEVKHIVGAPPHFLELDNGAVVLTFSDRVGPEIGARARISYDRGKTWSETDIDLIQNKILRCQDQSYPSTIQLDDGTLITIYYQAYENDPNASVLYTVWKLHVVE